MHALRILQQRLRQACPQIHLRRLTALLACVAGALRGQRLTLTELGRTLPSQARVKHSIKRVDRLLGNVHLGNERFDIYQMITHGLLTGTQRPVIVVDWSDLTADRRWQLLRAALPVGGRTLTLYEEVHPLRHLGNRRVHGAFLRQLKTILPAAVTPIVVTDAGFKAPWFKALTRMEWHWIGRVRGQQYVRAAGQTLWGRCKLLYAHASAVAQALGLHEIVRGNRVRCNLYLVQRPKKNRIHKSVFGQRCRSAHSLKHESGQRDPWLLAASPSLAALSATEIINIYARRMQIEEAFRDLKSDRYGLGFELHLSRGRERIATLLLIASLALLVLWQIGCVAIAHGLHLHYQSNTRTKRAVLSSINLACLMLRHVSYSSPPRQSFLHLRSVPRTAFNTV